MDATLCGQEIGTVDGKEQLQTRHYEAGVPLLFLQRHTNMRQAVYDAENNNQQSKADIPERQCTENEKSNPNQQNIDPEHFDVCQLFFAFRQFVDNGIDISLEAARPKVFFRLMKKIEWDVNKRPKYRLRRTCEDDEQKSRYNPQNRSGLCPILISG